MLIDGKGVTQFKNDRFKFLAEVGPKRDVVVQFSI